jgi:lysophospholipase L1-like esterase
MRQRLVLLLLFVMPVAAADAPGQVGPVRVACVGNSITYGDGGSQAYPAQLGALLGPAYTVVNFGLGGTTMLKKGDVPYWTRGVYFSALDFDPQIIILSLGTNDSKPWNWVYKDEFYTDYLDFVRSFRQNGRHPQIYICFPPPVFIDGFGITGAVIRNEIDPLIDSVRSTARTLFIDYHTAMLGQSANFPDGIHPNAAGYAVMAQVARDSLLNSPAGFVRYLAANRASFEMGESVTLYWKATTGSQVTLDGVPVNVADSLMASPIQTTTYTLIAKGPQFADTSRLTLQYFPPGRIKSFSAQDQMLDLGLGDSTRLTWTTSKGTTTYLQGQPVGPNSSACVLPAATTTYVLTAQGVATDTSRITVQVLPSLQINRALNRVMTSSSAARGYPPLAIVDGDTTTEWISDASAPAQWLLCDLRRSIQIRQLVMSWGHNHAVMYRIGISKDSSAWALLKTQLTGKGGVEMFDSLNGAGRFLKILLDKRDSTTSGYMLREMQVYGFPELLSALEPQSPGVPGEFRLFQNFPNPFNPGTDIRYHVPAAGDQSPVVSLKVYDMLGRELAEMVNESREPGSYTVHFDAGRIASGCYFYRMKAGAFVHTRKMLLLR